MPRQPENPFLSFGEGAQTYPQLNAIHVLAPEGVVKSGKPIVYIPGFLAEASSHRHTIQELSNQREIWAISPPLVSLAPENDRYTEFGVPRALWEKAKGVLAILEHLKGQEVSLVAHSEGAIVTALAMERALQDPQKYAQVRNLILVAPAGIVSETSTIGLVTRYLAHGLITGITDPIIRNQLFLRERATIRRQAGPLSEAAQRLWNQARAITSVDIKPKLKNLQEAGVHVDVIISAGDRVFREKLLREECKQHGIPWTILPGTHFAIQDARYARIYADTIEQLLMEK